ncbi:hypothetical protein ZIOFF_049594 [Zingiber officinale]|uniref:DUF4283 domain-containing protein n=1 Tax=Zingiber officinale TaxID=94328 RepID=A0A8J5FPV1_ZINOF|nr:hypothetical protein ZIOFF_049594 [Zingiber officinale]
MAVGVSKAPAPASLPPVRAPGPSSVALHRNPLFHSGATGGEATTQGGDVLAAAAVRGVGGDGGKAAAAQGVGGNDGGGDGRAAAAHCCRGGGGFLIGTQEKASVSPSAGASETKADTMPASEAVRALVHLLLAVCGGCGDMQASGTTGPTGEKAATMQQACILPALPGRGDRTGCMGVVQGRAAGSAGNHPGNPNPNPNLGAPEDVRTQQDAAAGAAIPSSRTASETQQRLRPALSPAPSPELAAAIVEALAAVMRTQDASLAPAGAAGGGPASTTGQAVAGEGGEPATGAAGILPCNPNPNPNPKLGALAETWKQQEAGAAIPNMRTTLEVQQRRLPALSPASAPELAAAIVEAATAVMRTRDTSRVPAEAEKGEPMLTRGQAAAGEDAAPAAGGVGEVCRLSDSAPAPPSLLGRLYVEALAPRSPRAAKKSFEEVGANFKEFSMCNNVPGETSPQIVYQGFKGLGLSSPYNIRFLRAGHIFLHLTSNADMARLWTRGVWRIGGSILRIFKWTPHFSYEAESSVVPVWVQFPDLPVHMFNKNCVFSMARIVGCPIKIDEATADGSRLFMARACVEIDLLKPRVEQFLIGIGDEHRLQRVVYERMPEYCRYCMHLGLAEADCFVAGNKPWPEWRRDRVDPIPPGEDLRERLNQRRRRKSGKAVGWRTREAEGEGWWRMVHLTGGKEALGDTPQVGTETDDGGGEEEDRVVETQLVEVEDRMPVQLGRQQTFRQTSQGLGQQDSVSVEGGEQQVGDPTSQSLGQGEQASQTVQRPGIGAQQTNTDGAQGQGGASRELQDASLISGEEPRVLESSGGLPEDDCLDRYSSSSADQGVSDDLGQKEEARLTQDIPEGSADPDFQRTFEEYEETDTFSSSCGGHSLASVFSPPRGRKAGMPKVVKAQRPKVGFEPRVTRSQTSKQARTPFH